MNFAVPADHRKKFKENKKRDQYVDLARAKKYMEHECDGDTNYNWGAWNDLKNLCKRNGRDRNWKMNQDNTNYNINKISQNTEKSHGHLRILLSLRLQ